MPAVRAGRSAWVAAAVLVGCGETDDARCLRLAQARAFADAAAACDAAFRRGGRAEVGIAAARAHYELEQDDDVLRIAGELVTGPKAGSAQHLIGRVWLARGDAARGRAALEEASRRHRDAGEHAAASVDATMVGASYWKEG